MDAAAPMTPPRELRVGDRVRPNSSPASGRDYVVTEFVAFRYYVTRDGMQYAMDRPGVIVQVIGKPVRRTGVRIDRIYMDGKLRKHGWSLVTP